MSAIVHPLATPTTPLDYALIYARLGWHVFPAFGIRDGKCTCGAPACKNPGKHPIGWLARRGQDDATTDPEQIRKWWTSAPDANVAIMLAPSGLVAIDIDPRNGGWDTIDDLEARHGAIASDVVQLTGGGGEHRLFSLPAALSAGLPGKLGPGVDVKRNGYIIAEPSSHASGKTYQWEASSSPLDGVIPSPLPDWMRGDFGGAAPQTLPVVTEPLSERDRADLAAALAFLPSDDREDWVRVGMALHATSASTESFLLWDQWSQSSAKYDPVDTTRVWRSFRNKGLSGVTKATVFAMAQERGWVNAAPAAVPIEPAPPMPVLTYSFDPQYLYTVPCKPLQKFVHWINGLYEEHHPGISVVGALALASVITGRVYRSERSNWTSLLYVVCGPTGIGKNYIQVGIERLLYRAGLESHVGGDFYTHQSAIYAKLRNAPAHICISDEFGENFLEARKNNNSNKMTVFKALKKVYSAADHMFKAESYASAKDTEDRRPVVNPSLTMVGLTTPLQFYSEIKTSHVEGGLMNRLIVVNIEPSGVGTTHERSGEPPDELVEFVKRVNRPIQTALPAAFDMEPAPIAVAFHPEAQALFDEFKAEQRTKSLDLEPVGLGAMPNRWREHAMRMATALAACENPVRPIVSPTHAKWCIAFVRHHGMDTIRRLGGQMGENQYQQDMNSVLTYIQGAGDKGRNMSELSRQFRSIKRREMVEIKCHLIESGLIAEETIPTAGRPVTRLISLSSKPNFQEKSAGDPHE